VDVAGVAVAGVCDEMSKRPAKKSAKKIKNLKISFIYLGKYATK
jgi:hypothetical protein